VTVLSVLGLLFAAIAAVGAWMTVRVTLQVQQEAKLRRVIDALISVEHAAKDLERLPAAVNLRLKADREDRLRLAQTELMRAGALPFVGTIPIESGDRATAFSELTGLLNSLTAVDIDIVQHPAEVSANANRAAVILTSRPESKSKSKWLAWLRWHLFHMP